MQREITLLQDENQDQISTYTSQKAEFTEGLCGLIDQIDDILRRDDECCIVMELEPIKCQNFIHQTHNFGQRCQWTSPERQQKSTRNV